VRVEQRGGADVFLAGFRAMNRRSPSVQMPCKEPGGQQHQGPVGQPLRLAREQIVRRLPARLCRLRRTVRRWAVGQALRDGEEIGGQDAQSNQAFTAGGRFVGNAKSAQSLPKRGGCRHTRYNGIGCRRRVLRVARARLCASSTIAVSRTTSPPCSSALDAPFLQQGLLDRRQAGRVQASQVTTCRPSASPRAAGSYSPDGSAVPPRPCPEQNWASSQSPRQRFGGGQLGFSRRKSSNTARRASRCRWRCVQQKMSHGLRHRGRRDGRRGIEQRPIASLSAGRPARHERQRHERRAQGEPKVLAWVCRSA